MAGRWLAQTTNHVESKSTCVTTVNAFAKFKQMDMESKTTVTRTRFGPVARSGTDVKDMLLRWCQAKTSGYPHVNVVNFSSSWCDGMAFCALIHHYYPDAFDFSTLDPKNRRFNFDLAFKTAEEKADIAPLLDVDDMILMKDKPDWKCVFHIRTKYVQEAKRTRL